MISAQIFFCILLVFSIIAVCLPIGRSRVGVWHNIKNKRNKTGIVWCTSCFFISIIVDIKTAQRLYMQAFVPFLHSFSV